MPDTIVVIEENPELVKVTEKESVVVAEGGAATTALFQGEGSSGLVPDPGAGDDDRILQADGSWAAQSGGGGGGGGAPTDAKYLVTELNGTLTEEQVLSAESGVVVLVPLTGSTLEIQIVNGGIANAKLVDMAEARLMGRASGGGTGAPQHLTAAQVLTLIGVEAGATADQTAGEILAALLTVDGTGSGLDADLLDGLEAAAFALASHTHAVDDITGVEQNRILGRVSAGTGVAEKMTAAQTRGILNVEDGATADQSDAEIKTAYENNADTNAFTDAEQTKLAGVEDSATADQTAGEIKTAYESNADTNAYTDAEKTKLAGVETAAKDDQNAAEVPYSNATSGLVATEVQAAIDEIDSFLDGLANGMTFQGDFDAGGGAGPVNFPGSGSAQAGALYVVTNAAAGGTTLGSSNAIVVHTGDKIIAAQDNASETDGAEWTKVDTTDAVSSVAGKIGAVTLETGDLTSIEQNRILGRISAGTGVGEKLTGAQVRTIIGQAATADIANDAVTYAKMQNVSAAARLLGRGGGAGAGDPQELSVGPGLAFSGTQLQRAALTGDVTASQGSNTTAIANNAVSNVKAADIVEARLKGRAAGAGTGDPQDLTAAQVLTILGVEAGATADQTAAEILAALLTVDGTGSGLDADLIDGFQGIALLARANHTGTQTLATISDSGALAALDTVDTAQIDDEAATLAKIQHIATARLLGRSTAGTGDVEELAAAAAKTILDIKVGDVDGDAEKSWGEHTHGFTKKSNTISSGAVTVDWRDGNVQELVLTENVTSLTFTAPSQSSRLVLIIKQNPTGGYTLAWPSTGSTLKWIRRNEPVISSGADDEDSLHLVYDAGTDEYQAVLLKDFGVPA